MSVSTVYVSVLLSVVCLGIVFFGGWYLQFSLLEQHFYDQQQSKQIEEQSKKIDELSKQIIKQNDQITQQHLQLEQLNIIINVFLNNNGKYKDHYETTDSITHHGIVKREEQSSQTQNDKTVIKLLQGRDGRDGRDGAQGIKGDVGERGEKGYQGEKGDQGKIGQKGEPAGSLGVAYVRWGHDSCPTNTGAQLVYSGRAGGSLWSTRGGGTNPQCLPLDPNYLKYTPGKQSYSYIYGAEYQQTNFIKANSQYADVPCAVCYVPTRTALYMIPAKYTCPTGWTTEYYGYLMAERSQADHRSSFFSCIDSSVTPVIGTQLAKYGLVFYPVEGRCGSLPCPPYEETKELTCAVCTK